MTLQVLPGYQRLTQPQRTALLDLYESAQLASPVTVRLLGGRRAIARDGAGASWLIHPDGSSEPTPTR